MAERRGVRAWLNVAVSGRTAGFPAFVEVAVTPLTQKYRQSGIPAAQGWALPAHMSDAAPHPPLAFHTVDYDGHQTTVVDASWTAARGSGVGRKIECWAPAPGAGAGGAWPFMGSGSPGFVFDGACRPVFDGDGGKGNMLKFDFDFGGNETSYYSTGLGNFSESFLFGSDLYRCPNQGMGLFPCTGKMGGHACVSSDGEYAACSGNAMFSQHVIHALDFPFSDVDNVEDLKPHISRAFRWWSAQGDGHPKGALTSHLFSAYMCYSGRRNQPPVFVAALQQPVGGGAFQAVNGLVGHVTPDTAVALERTCVAGEECVLDLFAVDLHVDEEGTTLFRTTDGGYTPCPTGNPKP